jgi:peptide/nickel transport system permease protein
LPVQYGLYVWRLVHGDLGTSIQSGLPIRSELGRVIPATVELAIIAVSIGVVFGLSLGTVAALHRNRWPDHILRVVSLAGISMPTFWIGLLALYVFFFVLNWVPGGGRLDSSVLPPPHETGLYTVDALLVGDWFALWNALHHLILPALVLAAFSVSVLTRFTRSAVLEVIEKDYVRAARAKGLSERNVVIGHVLRASFVSVLTVIGLVFANVLSGAILVEHIFGYPGLGQYAYQAAVTLDLPAIMGVSMFVAGVYVTINFIVDVLYGVIDPRVRIG